tara:strand:+ start:323 stop:778 length:456 start_codon:yes stop_codon:yes gene_type:complete
VFGTATEQFDEVKGDARKQMITLMEDTDDIVALSRLTVDINQGETKQIFIAFKNTGDIEEEFSTLTVVGGEGSSLKNLAGNCGTGKTSLEYKQATTSVVARDVVVLPINIVTDNPLDDVCYFEISVEHSSDLTDALIPKTTEKIALTVEII